MRSNFLRNGIFAISVVLSCVQGASAGPVGSCAKLRSFFLNFQTGGDDLRANSELAIYLMTTNGDVALQHVEGGFPNNSTNYRMVSLQNPNWDVDSCSVTGVKIKLISRPAWPETDDNWNLDGFFINGYSEQGEYKYSLSATGSPLKRFTASSPWWEKHE